MDVYELVFPIYCRHRKLKSRLFIEDCDAALKKKL